MCSATHVKLNRFAVMCVIDTACRNAKLRANKEAQPKWEPLERLLQTNDVSGWRQPSGGA